MTRDEEGFLAAIKAKPMDWTPALIYADWLEENRRPTEAEFIRLWYALVVRNHPNRASVLSPAPESEPPGVAAAQRKRLDDLKNEILGPDLAGVLDRERWRVLYDRGVIVALELGDSDIAELPGNLTVAGCVDLQDCAGITALPDNLYVGGYLDLRGTRITELPDNLHVGGSLVLDGTAITSLPDNLRVDGHLFLDRTRIGRRAATSIVTMPGLSDEAKRSGLRHLGYEDLADEVTCNAIGRFLRRNNGQGARGRG